MKTILDFMLALYQNNNKPWFDEHKAQYLEVKAKFDALSMDFMKGIERFDRRVHDLKLGDITYRIYRDMRFSQDKRPYKWHLGVYVCPKGKKSGMAGYYIHLEPGTDTYFICSGLYNPDKDILKSVREEIMCNPERFHEALQKCPDFHLPWEAALRKVPQGFCADDPHAEYYRLKSYELYKHLTREDVLQPDFLQKSLADLERTLTFNELINQCVDFARK